MSTSVKKEKKSILSMLCCACRTSKHPTRVQTQECDTNVPSDYVVEKLAIKNLPLTSFATAEDIMRYNRMNTTAKNVPYMKQTPLMASSSTLASSNRDTHIAMQPINTIKSNMPQLVMQVPTISSHNSVIKHEETVNPFHMQYSPKTVFIKDKEAQLVTNILNKHASLYTLDDKNPIPKNPLHPPRNTVVIPSSVQQAYAKDGIFPSKNNTVQVKVHNQSVPSAFKYPPRPQLCKKNMSPEIKETINALRLVQKPHFPGVQPKNQKSIIPSITPQLTETEMSSRLLVDSKNDNFLEIESQILPPSIPVHNKFTLEHNIPKIIENSETEEFLSNIYLQRKSSSVDEKSSESNILEALIHPHVKNEKMSSDEIEKSDDLKPSSLETIAVNQQKCDTSTTNQLKGQNLKWKIIIKHHAEKSKPSSEINRDLVNKELQYNVRQCLLDDSLNFPG